MKNDSHKKILEMLSGGKISVEEATALLSKLQDPAIADDEISEVESAEVHKRTPKYLRVVVDSAGGDKVNVRVPLSLIKTGIKLTALVPGKVVDKMSSHGFDLSQLSELDSDELIDALRDMQVDVESADGDIIKIFTE